MVSSCFRSVLSYYYSYIYPLQNIQEQQALIARLAEQQQQEQEQEEQDAQPSNRGRKRSAWGELEQQGKKVCTASIQAEVEHLAEERDCRPETILANVMHR